MFQSALTSPLYRFQTIVQTIINSSSVLTCMGGYRRGVQGVRTPFLTHVRLFNIGPKVGPLSGADPGFRRGGGFVHSEGGVSYRNFRSGSKLLQGPGQINKQKKIADSRRGGFRSPPKKTCIPACLLDPLFACRPLMDPPFQKSWIRPCLKIFVNTVGGYL